MLWIFTERNSELLISKRGMWDARIVNVDQIKTIETKKYKFLNWLEINEIDTELLVIVLGMLVMGATFGFSGVFSYHISSSLDEPLIVPPGESAEFLVFVDYKLDLISRMPIFSAELNPMVYDIYGNFAVQDIDLYLSPPKHTPGGRLISEMQIHIDPDTKLGTYFISIESGKIFKHYNLFYLTVTNIPPGTGMSGYTSGSVGTYSGNSTGTVYDPSYSGGTSIGGGTVYIT